MISMKPSMAEDGRLNGKFIDIDYDLIKHFINLRYAPESYKNGIFSHSSDVWSYGIILWEMFSLGEVPYGEMLGSEAVKLIEDGKRLLQPKFCPNHVYTIMENCWKYNPKDRPTFSFLTEVFVKDPDYENIIELVKANSIN